MTYTADELNLMLLFVLSLILGMMFGQSFSFWKW